MTIVEKSELLLSKTVSTAERQIMVDKVSCHTAARRRPHPRARAPARLPAGMRACTKQADHAWMHSHASTRQQAEPSRDAHAHAHTHAPV